MKQRVLLSLILITLTTVACTSAPNFDEPPEIRYGEDICERCTMIISEPRYAAAYVTTEGEARRFDDIGGMLAHNRAVSEEVAVFWVHDFDTEEWLKADDAYFVESEHITPMGYGIVAFMDSGRAEAWAVEKGGQVLSFAQLS
jgi:copper chaperone NosL